MKYAILLRSKHTGQETYLGVAHETRELAQDYADKEVCTRCNRYEIFPVPDDSVWIGRREGFRMRG